MEAEVSMERPQLLPPLTLAYVGDAVYELFVREHLLAAGYARVGDLHKRAVRFVRASAQARALTELLPDLTPAEQDIVRRARNAKGHAAPKGSDPVEYAAATSFEALVGYLHLGGEQERLQAILDRTAEHLSTDGKGRIV